MTIYRSTPDYYNDYISHGWAKDAAAKVHKYIERWRGKNGKWYYRYKSKAQEGLAKIARGRWKTADGKSLSSETITRNARKPGLQLSKKDYGKAGYNPWSSGLRPTGKTYRLNKRNIDAGLEAGRKRTGYRKYKIVKKGSGINARSRGYSDSRGSSSNNKATSGRVRGIENRNRIKDNSAVKMNHIRLLRASQRDMPPFVGRVPRKSVGKVRRSNAEIGNYIFTGETYSDYLARKKQNNKKNYRPNNKNKAKSKRRNQSVRKYHNNKSGSNLRNRGYSGSRS